MNLISKTSKPTFQTSHPRWNFSSFFSHLQPAHHRQSATPINRPPIIPTLPVPQPPLPANLPLHPFPQQNRHIHRPFVQELAQPGHPPRIVAGILQDREESFRRPQSHRHRGFVFGHAAAVAAAGYVVDCVGCQAGRGWEG